MTNSENQRIRDKEKYLESERLGYDKAGDMTWCEFCEFSTTCMSSISGKRCDYGGTSGDFEKVPYPCATAYNRMMRKNYEARVKSSNVEKYIKLN